VTALVVISTLVSAVATVIYIVLTLRGSAKPRPASWAIWAAILAIGAAASAETGQFPAAAYNSVAALENAAVAILALWIPAAERDPPVWVRLPRGPKVALDLFCLAGAGAGLILLAVVRNPVLAIVAAMATEFAGYVPTAVSVWRRPQNEPWPVYVLYAAATAVVVTAVWLPWMGGQSMPVFTATAMPLYLTVADGSVAAMIFLRMGWPGWLAARARKAGPPVPAGYLAPPGPRFWPPPLHHDSLTGNCPDPLDGQPARPRWPGGRHARAAPASSQASPAPLLPCVNTHMSVKQTA
jgi:hypothetical protein